MLKNLLFLLCATTHTACMIYIPTPKIFQQKELDMNLYYKDSCAYWNRLSFEYRMDEIPFKGAEKVEIVSFEIPNKGIRGIDKPIEGEIPKEKPKEIDHYNTFFERFSLAQNDLDTLSQMMHFSDTSILIKPLPKRDPIGIYDKNPRQKSTTGCFNPRHALLFYGKNGEQYARWDFCFECGNHEINGIYYTQKMDSFTCNEQEKRLKQFFKRIGITKFLK